MPKRMTHPGRMRYRMAAAMFETMELLGWTEEQYFWNLVDTGRLYMVTLLEPWDDGQGAEGGNYQQLSNSDAFWAWWRVQWMKRERDWLAEIRDLDICQQNRYLKELEDWKAHSKDGGVSGFAMRQIFGNYGAPAMRGKPMQPPRMEFDKQQLAEEYKLLHNGRILAEAITPDGVVMEESYCRELAPLLR